MFLLRKARCSNLGDQKLGYGRLAIAMWLFENIRRELSSWRKANKESKWEEAIEDIFLLGEEKSLSPKLKLAFENIKLRLNICGMLKKLSSGHVNCPVPQSQRRNFRYRGKLAT